MEEEIKMTGKFNPMYLGVDWRECSRSSRYIITEYGDVYSLSMAHPTKYGRKKTQKITQDGYPRVKIGHEYIAVHRLVAESFLSNDIETHQVNHKDGNKANNHVSNLEWISQAENIYHAMENGNHPKPRRPVKGINVETGEIIRFESQSAAKKAGFTQSNIAKCLSGDRPTSQGYKWEYDDENRLD